MALVIGARVGDVIDIGSTWITVCSIDDDRTAIIRTADDRLVELSSEWFRTIFANVDIGLGPAPATKSLKLVVRAPRSIHVGRRKPRR
jgi:hypothetical protein